MASTGSLEALAFYNNSIISSIISGDLASVRAYIKESRPNTLECLTAV
jgi:hypothetical protein